MQVDLFAPSPAMVTPPPAVPCPWQPGERFCYVGRWYTVEPDGQMAVALRPWDGATLTVCDACGKALTSQGAWVRGGLIWTNPTQDLLDDKWEFWGRHGAGPINNPAFFGWRPILSVVGHATCLGVPAEMR